MAAIPMLSLPVAVILGCKTVSGERWQVRSWRVVGVVAGENVPGKETRGEPAGGTDDEPRLIWGGLRLDLYRDAAESYWVNLTGQQPSLFVLCSEAEDGALVPRFVTADQNEACSGVEGDDRVFAAAIPPEVYQQLEQFVVEYNVPQEKRKRKRTNWAEREES
jgi:hypothetical protein